MANYNKNIENAIKASLITAEQETPGLYNTITKTSNNLSSRNAKMYGNTIESVTKFMTENKTKIDTLLNLLTNNKNDNLPYLIFHVINFLKINTNTKEGTINFKVETNKNNNPRPFTSKSITKISGESEILYLNNLEAKILKTSNYKNDCLIHSIFTVISTDFRLLNVDSPIYGFERCLVVNLFRRHIFPEILNDNNVKTRLKNENDLEDDLLEAISIQYNLRFLVVVDNTYTNRQYISYYPENSLTKLTKKNLKIYFIHNLDRRHFSAIMLHNNMFSMPFNEFIKGVKNLSNPSSVKRNGSNVSRGDKVINNIGNRGNRGNMAPTISNRGNMAPTIGRNNSFTKKNTINAITRNTLPILDTSIGIEPKLITDKNIKINVTYKLGDYFREGYAEVSGQNYVDRNPYLQELLKVFSGDNWTITNPRGDGICGLNAIMLGTNKKPFYIKATAIDSDGRNINPKQYNEYRQFLIEYLLKGLRIMFTEKNNSIKIESDNNKITINSTDTDNTITGYLMDIFNKNHTDYKLIEIFSKSTNLNILIIMHIGRELAYKAFYNPNNINNINIHNTLILFQSNGHFFLINSTDSNDKITTFKNIVNKNTNIPLYQNFDIDNILESSRLHNIPKTVLGRKNETYLPIIPKETNYNLTKSLFAEKQTKKLPPSPIKPSPTKPSTIKIIDNTRNNFFQNETELFEEIRFPSSIDNLNWLINYIINILYIFNINKDDPLKNSGNNTLQKSKNIFKIIPTSQGYSNDCLIMSILSVINHNFLRLNETDKTEVANYFRRIFLPKLLLKFIEHQKQTHPEQNNISALPHINNIDEFITNLKGLDLLDDKLLECIERMFNVQFLVIDENNLITQYVENLNYEEEPIYFIHNAGNSHFSALQINDDYINKQYPNSYALANGYAKLLQTSKKIIDIQAQQGQIENENLDKYMIKKGYKITKDNKNNYRYVNKKDNKDTKTLEEASEMYDTETNLTYFLESSSNTNITNITNTNTNLLGQIAEINRVHANQKKNSKVNISPNPNTMHKNTIPNIIPNTIPNTNTNTKNQSPITYESINYNNKNQIYNKKYTNFNNSNTLHRNYSLNAPPNTKKNTKTNNTNFNNKQKDLFIKFIISSTTEINRETEIYLITQLKILMNTYIEISTLKHKIHIFKNPVFFILFIKFKVKNVLSKEDISSIKEKINNTSKLTYIFDNFTNNNYNIYIKLNQESKESETRQSPFNNIPSGPLESTFTNRGNKRTRKNTTVIAQTNNQQEPIRVKVKLYSNKIITNTNIESLRKFLINTFGHIENKENGCNNEIKPKNNTIPSNLKGWKFVLPYDDICIKKYNTALLGTELNKLKVNPLQIISEKINDNDTIVYISLAPINEDFD